MFWTGKPIKNLPDQISVDLGDSGIELYKQLAKDSGSSVHRLKITKGSDGSFLPKSKDLTINDTGLREQSTIYVKDLGRPEALSYSTIEFPGVLID